MNSLFIKGEWQEGSGNTLNSINPADGRVVWTGSEAQPADVAESVSAACEAFFQWSLTELLNLDIRSMPAKNGVRRSRCLPEMPSLFYAFAL